MNEVYASGEAKSSPPTQALKDRPNAPRPLRQALGLFLTGALIGVAVNAFHPQSLHLLQPWTPPDARAAQSEGLKLIEADSLARHPLRGDRIILDARDARDYDGGHLPGAVSLPWNEFDQVYPRVEPLLDDPHQPVLVYCAHAQCDDGLMLAKELRRRGAVDVSLLQGGFEAWRKAGGAVEREPAP